MGMTKLGYVPQTPYIFKVQLKVIDIIFWNIFFRQAYKKSNPLIALKIQNTYQVNKYLNFIIDKYNQKG